MVGAKILVVEDESIVSFAIQKTLKGLGHIISGAASAGEEAIQKAGDCQPDLVLMDIGLRGEMDGVVAAGEIRRRFQIPVVYLTAYADDTTFQRAKLTEPFAYLIKPLEERELQIAIDMARYKHQMEKERMQLTNQLRDALAKIKTLSGLLPICGFCKRIRDDKGYWEQVESYISKHSEAQFSHGVCPECVKKYYGEFFDKAKDSGSTM